MFPQKIEAANVTFTATINESDAEDTIRVDWELSTQNDFSSLVDFVTNEAITVEDGLGTFTRSVDLDPTQPTTYFWRVRATDNYEAKSPWSITRSITVYPDTTTTVELDEDDPTDLPTNTTPDENLPAPEAPQPCYTNCQTTLDFSVGFSINLVAKADAKYITLTWNNPEKAASNRIYRSTKPVFSPSKTHLLTQIEPAATNYTDSQVIPGTTYYYMVTALSYRQDETKASNIVSSTVIAKQSIVEQIKDSDQLPTLVAGISRSVAVAGILGLGSALSLSLLLQSLTNTLLTASSSLQLVRFIFLAWWPKKKGKPWGIVYNKDTRLPLAGILVRLITPEFQKTIDEVNTDQAGRYGFLIQKSGHYQIAISANGYEKYLSPKFKVEDPKTIPKDLDIYLTQNEGSLVTHTLGIISKIAQVVQWLNHLRIPVLIFGLLLATYNLIFFYDATNLFVFILYVVFWIIELALLYHSRPYGQIISQTTEEPIDRAIVRLYRLKLERFVLTLTTISDSQGRFRILTPPGTYIIQVNHIGFQDYKTKIMQFKKFSQPNVTIELKDR